MIIKKKSVWKGRYYSLKEYYEKEYCVPNREGIPFYEFDKYQLEVDPDETLEDLEAYDLDRQNKEIVKCATSFYYFAQKYVKILHPTAGLIPFILYKYQHTVIKNYEEYRFNIVSKFRQGGLTTTTLLWGLWRCMFKLDQQVLLLSKTDREATNIGMIVDRAIEHLPNWMKPKQDGKWNDHLKMFTDTGGALKFYSPEAARSQAVTFLIVDEAAFIPDMEEHWKAMWPVLSTGGSCAVISTVNGMGNWYQVWYHDAVEKRNKFNVIDLDYWVHPDYTEEWAIEQKAQLGEKGFLQEVLRQFLGSGNTYIPHHVITRLTEETRNSPPIRKFSPQWVNKRGPAAQLDEEYNKGALWVWEPPIDGHEYILGADCAEGQEENNDASVFEILDIKTMKQVAEFYSNLIPPNQFADMIHAVATAYNLALVVVEDMGPGGAVLAALQHILFYENLFVDLSKGTKTKAPKPGIKVGRINRPMILECIQNRLLNNSMQVNSTRFVNELVTFEFNPNTKRAEAQKGKHDDAITAMGMALFVRDTMLQHIPVGADIPVEITDKIKSQVYQEIRKELQAGLAGNLLEKDELLDLLALDKNNPVPGISLRFQRKSHKLLLEFGW